MATEIQFEHVGHFIRIPVGIPNGDAGRFLVDTGIGITMVSSGFAQQHRLEPTGRDFVGTRMAGDTVTAPLMRLPTLEVGDRQFSDLTVAVADLGPTGGPSGFDGIVGLDLFGDLPLTIDPFRARVRLGGDPDPQGTSIPVVVERNEESVCLYVEVCLPDGTVVMAEVDTGSGSTVLDNHHMASCGVTLDNPAARSVRVENETGADVERSFIPVPGPISLSAARETAQRGSTVMFQDIGLDGLIGASFLDRYVQTFDTRSSTMTLSPRRP